MKNGRSGVDRLLLVDILDRLVGQIFVQGVVSLAALGDLHLDRLGSRIERRLPLVGLAADEAVEMIEALQSRPAVERSRDAGLPIRDIVVLAEERGAVAVLAEDFRAHRLALGNLPGVARKAAAQFGDDAGARRVVIATRQQGGARGRAKRSGVKPRVTQAFFGEPVEIRGRNLSAERAPLAEAEVVDEDEKDIGRAGRRLDERNFVRRGIPCRSGR